MSGSLEKIFVFFVTISGLALLFLFGLYFDVGELFVAIIGHEDPRSAGGVETELADWAGRGQKPKERPRDLVAAGDGVVLSESELAFVFTSPLQTGAQRAKTRAAELRAKGFTNQAFIEMESLGANLDEFNAAMRGVNELLGLENMPEAVHLLEQKIKAESPENLLVMREYYTVLVRLHYELNDLEKAYTASSKLTEILDRIISLRKIALKEVKMAEIEQTIPTLEAEKALLDEIYRTTRPRIEKNGSAYGFLDEEKAQMKEMLDQALAGGELKQADYDQAVKELGL